MANFRHWRAAAIIGVVMTATPAASQVTDPMAGMPAWSRSVVKIWVSCPGVSVSGAATVISQDGLVLTAAHVGSGCIGQTARIRIGFITNPYREPAFTHDATLVRRRADNVDNPTVQQVGAAKFQDIALYRITALTPGETFPSVPVEANAALPGEKIRVAGFSNFPFEYQGSANRSAGISIYEANLISIAADQQGTPFRLHYTGGTLMGMSGGPVFNDAGRLIGIHSTRVNDSVSSFSNVLNVLTNYSWATSVLAVPDDWTP